MTPGGPARLVLIGAGTGAAAGLVGVVLLGGARAITVAIRVGPLHDGVGTVVAPVGAGLLCLLLQRRVGGASGTGVAAAVAAARLGRPLSWSAGVAHFVGTLACVGTGWAGGREGPMLHAGAAIGSSVADVLTPAARRDLMGAGAAGGIAGVINTPVAATLLVWGLFARGRLGLTVAGACGGAVVHRLLWAHGPLLPVFGDQWASVVTACAVGLAAAVVALVYVAAVRAATRVGNRTSHPAQIPGPVIGGLLAGVVVLVVPDMGSGERVLSGGAMAAPSVPLIVCLLLAAIAAPALTVATRGCGGTMGPALVLGAVVGELAARTLAADATACRLVGMAALLAAATRQPLMAVALVIELTGALGSVPAVAVGTAVAWFAASRCTTATIFDPAIFKPADERSPEGPP